MTSVSWCRWDCRAELSTQLLLVVEPAPVLELAQAQAREQVLAQAPVLELAQAQAPVLELAQAPGPVWAHRRRPAIVPSEQSIE
jgi:hypothetical protein